tara:strand:+ start:98 stop:625 length:528 start_codon:yes stop_codon:yes gene_type:complete
MEVRLSWEEVRCGAQHGLERGLTALKRGWSPRHGGVEDRFRNHILGAVGEIAVAKGLDLYWSGVVGPDVTDVGWLYEVRSTMMQNPKLTIYESDMRNPGQGVVLAQTINFQDWRMLGWKNVVDCMEDRFLDRRLVGEKRQWLIPVEELEEMSELVTGVPDPEVLRSLDQLRAGDE